jgi:hypothetical protein
VDRSKTAIQTKETNKGAVGAAWYMSFDGSGVFFARGCVCASVRKKNM